MWMSIKSTFALNPTNLDDVQIIKALVDIQAMFVVAGYKEQLLAALQTVVDQQTALMIE